MYLWCKACPPHSLGEPGQSSCCTCAHSSPLASTQTCFYMCSNTRREQHKTYWLWGTRACVSCQRAAGIQWKHLRNQNSSFNCISIWKTVSELLMLHPFLSSCVIVSIEMNLRLSGEWPCPSSYLTGRHRSPHSGRISSGNILGAHFYKTQYTFLILLHPTPLTETGIYCTNCTFTLSPSAAHTERSVAHTYCKSVYSVLLSFECLLVLSVNAMNVTLVSFKNSWYSCSSTSMQHNAKEAVW